MLAQLIAEKVARQRRAGRPFFAPQDAVVFVVGGIVVWVAHSPDPVAQHVRRTASTARNAASAGLTAFVTAWKAQTTDAVDAEIKDVPANSAAPGVTGGGCTQ
ncbi:MAG TPA: hypothetical protein VFT64_05115 [Rickettsiales bacterium]|nr:hypothetical protein [Rickettsiales bacterium]